MYYRDSNGDVYDLTIHSLPSDKIADNIQAALYPSEFGTQTSDDMRDFARSRMQSLSEENKITFEVPLRELQSRFLHFGRRINIHYLGKEYKSFLLGYSMNSESQYITIYCGDVYSNIITRYT